MATESTTKVINFVKQELIDYLDLSFITGLTMQNAAVLSTDAQGSEFVFGSQDNPDDETGVINSYTVSFSELVTNILLAIDPNISANDITDVNMNSDFSKITVEYT